MIMSGVGPPTTSGTSSGGTHAVAFACLGRGPPFLRPGLSRGCRQRITKRTAAWDSSRCLDSLRWCGAGPAWDASQADSVRQHALGLVRLPGTPPKIFSQEEAARMLFRSMAGYETASEVTAVSFRDARVSLPARLDDTPLASHVVGEEAKQFLSEWEDEVLLSPLEALKGLTMLFLPNFYVDPHFCSRRGVYVCLLRRLRALRLLHWNLHTKGHVGLFFVRKKGDKPSMIKAARAVNDRLDLSSRAISA